MLRYGRTILASAAFGGGREGYGTSVWRKLARLAALLMVVLAGLVQAGIVTSYGSQTYQLIDDFGLNANHRSWTNNELEPVLD